MNSSKKNILQSIQFFYQRELKTILTDPGAILIMILAVFIYSTIYTYSYSPEVIRELEVAVVDLDNSMTSKTVADMFDETQEININVKANSLLEAENLFYEGKVHGVLLIPKDFEEDINKHKSPALSIYSDASYFLMYKQTLTGALVSSETFNATMEVKNMLIDGENYEKALQKQNPLNIKYLNLFNPMSGYATYIMPGIILVILQQTLLIGIGLLGGTRKEKGNIKSPEPKWRYRNRENVLPLILGKSLAYLTIYIFNAAYALIWISEWFGLPLKADFLTILMLLIPYFLACSFLGLTLSILFKRRENAILLIVYLSPIILFLSGFSWPKEAIPQWLNIFGLIFPSTFAVPAYLRLQIMGVEIYHVKYEMLCLIAQMIIYFITAVVARRWSYKKYVNHVLS